MSQVFWSRGGVGVGGRSVEQLAVSAPPDSRQLETLKPHAAKLSHCAKHTPATGVMPADDAGGAVSHSVNCATHAVYRRALMHGAVSYWMVATLRRERNAAASRPRKYASTPAHVPFPRGANTYVSSAMSMPHNDGGGGVVCEADHSWPSDMHSLCCAGGSPPAKDATRPRTPLPAASCARTTWSVACDRGVVGVERHGSGPAISCAAKANWLDINAVPCCRNVCACAPPPTVWDAASAAVHTHRRARSAHTMPMALDTRIVPVPLCVGKSQHRHADSSQANDTATKSCTTTWSSERQCYNVTGHVRRHSTPVHTRGHAAAPDCEVHRSFVPRRMYPRRLTSG